ncbi:helix-turn-helix domain-containing protein [Vagococcus sp. BWB3-3]|uniref:Helix-turn-helix domain-containing protein n=1 Tax=Vagococcus allomyrinae TaxID=2794353 RepID=A0A940PE78_9ENTE|nr:helix-turn-helix domain-containing protein [Vagococcus allomyrinae]MBP1042348.1 helix-turn-helix domain-containing protein [Vagococcus allomyrinae]
MSNIIGYLDTQSDIQLMSDFNLSHRDLRKTELFLLLKGTANLKLEEVDYVMRVDDLIVINKHEEFLLKSQAGDNLLFRFSISDFLLSQAFDAEHISFNCNSIAKTNKNYEQLRRNIVTIIELLLFENERTNFLQLSKIYKLLNELSSLFSIQNEAGLNHDERISQITREIKQRYYEKVTLQDMAELVHMDGAYLSKKFKEEVGLNFKDYLSDVRLRFAYRDLLSSDKSITRVAVDNGFFSVNAFNKKFKDVYNSTPSEYRQQNKLEEELVLTQPTTEMKAHYQEYKDSKNLAVGGKEFKLELNFSSLEPRLVKDTWRSILNIGQAEIVLKSNLKEHLALLQRKLEFKYGRIWALFTPKILGEDSYHFESVDEILDSLLELGLIPWISLNKSAANFRESEYSPGNWARIMASFSTHLLNRYGRQRIKNWRVEIVLDDYQDEEVSTNYRDFYQRTTTILRQTLPEIEIGGGNFPATTDIDLAHFLEVELAGCQFDFYSFGLFPYASKLVREKRNLQRISDPDFLRQQVKLINEVKLEKPVYISEWSNTVSRSNLLNDSLYKGAFMVKSLLDLFEEVAGLGYWLGTDLAQKSHKGAELLSGGSGLINKNGLAKPAMTAMIFFNQLIGLKILYKDDYHLVCSTEEEEFFILGHQYTHPNSLYFLKDESQLKLNEVTNFFKEEEFLDQIILRDIPNGNYELRMFSCLKGHGDLLEEWANFNYSSNLRASDLSYLDAKNNHLQTLEEIEVTDKSLVLQKIKTTNEFYLINIIKRQ